MTDYPRPVGGNMDVLVPPRGIGPDRTIRWLAGRQHDVVSRRQLLEAGLGQHQITRRVRRGVLTRVHLGVFALSARPLPPLGRCAAALLACPPGAVISHRSAAQVHGMLAPASGPIHVTTGCLTRSRPGLVVHRSRSLAESTTTRDGIPCTTIPRTLIDLAGQAGLVAATRGWSNLGGRRSIDLRAFERELDRYPHRPGSAIVRRLVETHRATLSGTTRSEREAMAITMCSTHGLPMPQINALLKLDDRTYEIDLLWREARLAVEIDSWGTHGHVSSFRDDRARDFALQAAGWAVVRLLRSDIEVDAATTARKLRALIERRPSRSGGMTPGAIVPFERPRSHPAVPLRPGRHDRVRS